MGDTVKCLPLSLHQLDSLFSAIKTNSWSYKKGICLQIQGDLNINTRICPLSYCNFLNIFKKLLSSGYS
jgi:hypothetical protein